MKIIITLPHISKTACFSKHFVLSTIGFQFLFNFRGRKCLLLFNGVLVTQEMELILLCMDYDVAIRLENVESQK